jgi:hypothetical protein
MNIQDWVFTLGSFIFSIALIPAIASKTDKPPIKTSAPTALVLYAFCWCYLTLGLYLSFVSGLLTAILWTILFLQKIKNENSRN